jgi:hypothetical protein
MQDIVELKIEETKAVVGGATAAIRRESCLPAPVVRAIDFIESLFQPQAKQLAR